MRNGAQSQQTAVMAPGHLNGSAQFAAGAYVGYPQSRHSWGQFPVSHRSPTSNGEIGVPGRQSTGGPRPLSHPPPPPPPSRREIQRAAAIQQHMKQPQQQDPRVRAALLQQAANARCTTPSVSPAQFNHIMGARKIYQSSFLKFNIFDEYTCIMVLGNTHIRF